MSRPVLADLTTWSISSNDTPLAVLYGEEGSGKTVTSQAVVARLRADSPGAFQMHYFPLKYAEFAADGVPTLPEILTESIRRHWTAETPPLPTGESVLAAARARPTLFVVDGFEWLLSRWTESPQRQVLMFELLKLVPMLKATGEWMGPYAGAQAKVLLTLRPRHGSLLHEQLTHQHRYMELELL